RRFEPAIAGLERGVAVEQVPRLHGVVPVELEQRAVKLIRPATRHHVDLPARAFSKLRTVVAGLNLELFDYVHRRPAPQKILVLIRVPRAMQKKTILLGTHAADGNAAAGCAAVIPRVHSGEQQSELHEIAAIQWEVNYLLPIDDRADGRLLGLKQSR